MKCEYCDNELPSDGVEACPHCGASLVKNSGRNSVQTSTEEVLEVTCPHCRTVYEIEPDEWGKSSACKICHRQFPLVYGTVSPSQLNHIFLLRALKVVRAWRKKGLLVAQASGDVNLKAGEVLYCKIRYVTLSESRGVRRTVSKRSSRRDYSHDYNYYSNRVRKTGERYRYSGRSETNTDYEYRELDNGTLFLTNRRVFFVGNQMQRYIDLEKIVSFVPYYGRGAGEIRISEESKQKVCQFSARDGFCNFSLVMKALRDPNFKRLVTCGTDEEVTEALLSLDYFKDYRPQKPKALPSPRQQIQHVQQEAQSTSEFSIPTAVKTVFGVGVTIGVLLLISNIIASALGVNLIWVLIGILVVIGPIVCGMLGHGDKYLYKGMVYVDVSEMGTLRLIIASFMAGLHGEGTMSSLDKEWMLKDGAERL